MVYRDATPATLMGLVALKEGGSGSIGSTNSHFRVEFSVDGMYRLTPANSE